MMNYRTIIFVVLLGGFKLSFGAEARAPGAGAGDVVIAVPGPAVPDGAVGQLIELFGDLAINDDCLGCGGEGSCCARRGRLVTLSETEGSVGHIIDPHTLLARVANKLKDRPGFDRTRESVRQALARGDRFIIECCRCKEHLEVSQGGDGVMTLRVHANQPVRSLSDRQQNRNQWRYGACQRRCDTVCLASCYCCCISLIVLVVSMFTILGIVVQLCPLENREFPRNVGMSEDTAIKWCSCSGRVVFCDTRACCQSHMASRSDDNWCFENRYTADSETAKCADRTKCTRGTDKHSTRSAYECWPDYLATRK